MIRRDQKLQLIAKVPLFAGCSKRELAKVASLLDEVDIAAGTTLARKGATGHEFCIVVEGQLDVLDGKKKLASLQAGDFFGEIALILDAPRSASVVTTTPARILVAERTAFRSLLRDLPSLQEKVLEALAARLARESL